MKRRTLLSLSLCSLWIRPAPVWPAPPEVLGAEQAAAHIGETVTLEYAVREVGQSGDARYLELYSEAAWNTPGCVYLRVPAGFAQRAASLGIVDLAALLKGRTVRAEGPVDWLSFDDYPGHRFACLTLDDPGGLQILPPRLARKTVHGFTVYTDEAQAASARREVGEVEATVAEKLEGLVRLVPEAVLARLREVPVTIRRGANPASAAYDWRDTQASLLQLAPWQGVMINNWYEFVRVSREDQPLGLLHEFAHAYHHRVLGGDHPGVLHAYRRAMDEGLYEQVARRGQTDPERAYAATNEKEYFCELSEAWFGANDFFPFDRRDLEGHDPVGAQLMRDTWGEPGS